MIPYGRQTIDQEDIDAVVEVLRSDWLTQGPSVTEFEQDLAAYCGVKYAVVFNNGTSALQAAYHAAGLADGDEVVSTPLTFSATTNAALWFRAVPLFADIDLITGNIDVSAVEKLISTRTRVITPVDFAGHPAALTSLMDLAKSKGLIVVEDGCHALGAVCEGRRVGSIADMTTFSFHPVKSITTGEGGALLTDNQTYFDRAVRFRGQGITKEGFINESPGAWYHEMQTLGMNLRLTDFQCALGKSQLKKLPGFIERRQAIASRYLEAFKNLSFTRVIKPAVGDESSWHLFVLVLEGSLASKRDKIFHMLRNRGIGVQLHYMPVYRHPYYQNLGYPNGLCPTAEELSSQILSLPIFPTLSEHDQNLVIDAVIDTLQAFE